MSRFELAGTGDEVVMTLTDDEVTALAVRAGRGWPVALPTVDAQNEVDVASAGLRGVRSLIARELLSQDDDRLAVTLGGLSTAVFEGGPLLALFPADPAVDVVYRSWAVVQFVEAPGTWLTDVTTSTGLHSFQRTGVPRAIDRTVEVLSSVFIGDEVGLELLDGDWGRRIVASGRVSAGAIRLVEVGRGELVGRTTYDDGTITEDALVLDELAGVLEAIATV